MGYEHLNLQICTKEHLDERARPTHASAWLECLDCGAELGLEAAERKNAIVKEKIVRG